MGVVSFLFAAAAFAVQFGWTPLPDGGNEYVIQVEPQLMSTFEKEGFTSDVPPELRDIRRIRVHVGTDPIPNHGVTALKPPLDVPPDQRPSARSVYDSKFTLAGGVGDATPTGSRPAKVNIFQTEEDELNSDSKPKSAASRSTVTNASEQTHGHFNSSDAGSDEFDNGPSSAKSPMRVPPTPAGEKLAAKEPEQPLTPMIAAVVALFASIGGNIYLGWLHVGTRRQYQDVVRQLRAAESDNPFPVT